MESNSTLSGVHNGSSQKHLERFSRDILEMDENNAGHLVELDLQEKNRGRTGYVAPRQLLRLKPEVKELKTIRLLKRLFQTEGRNERDRQTFLDAIVKTRVMSYTMNFLMKAGKITGDRKSFAEILDKLWFTEYSRGGVVSSGFKHVFMGEPKGADKVNGFHNWVFFALEQAENNIEYMGWFDHQAFRNSKGSVVSLAFRWKRMLKKMGSIFVGTSPELEMALYTGCFLAAGPTAQVSLGGVPLTIKTMSQTVDDNRVIATAYPVV